ncbi:hypothetical protein M9H77_08719 [Catharanthus roseus]|uniref:Uncharacterized protein n=1 Tax=Catharanthus roseus TaxID=4058 RepID=A0ACC0BYS6_CATRO|nr:hypothetical protein M9H77_08719 [Catharanthus roseus]
MVDEIPRRKELPQAKIEKSLETHVEKEISSDDSCDNMNEKSVEKEECIETKEKDRKEYELEKSESEKENECFIEKQESIEKEQKEKEVVALDKSEVVLKPSLDSTPSQGLKNLY